MKRYFIFRMNGIDTEVTDDTHKVIENCEYLKSEGWEYRTEINFLTTTYNFTVKPNAE